MVKKEINKIEKLLKELFKVRGISLDKVVLFGSSARGEETKDSDIDLILVSKHFRDKDIFERASITGRIHRELVRNIKKPFDILSYSDIEWEEGSSMMIDEAKKDGIIMG